jgi:hypothetical protein
LDNEAVPTKPGDMRICVKVGYVALEISMMDAKVAVGLMALAKPKEV